MVRMMGGRARSAADTGDDMRTGALWLALLMTALLPSTADAAKAKRGKAKPAAVAAAVDPNEAGRRVLMDGLPLVMPSAVMLYMLHQKEMEAKAAAAGKGKR